MRTLDVRGGPLGPQARPGSPACRACPRVLPRPADSALPVDLRLLHAGVNGTTSAGSPSTPSGSARGLPGLGLGTPAAGSSRRTLASDSIALAWRRPAASCLFSAR